MLKTELREKYLLKRSTLRQEKAAQFNIKISECVFDFLKQNDIRLLHTFLPRSGKREIDTWQIINLIWTKYPAISLVAPRVIPGTSEMEHFLLNAETTLLSSAWEIPEPDPKSSHRIEPQNLDAILIPLLAFDQKGYRVGYGGGFYDRFLHQCNTDAIKIGLSFFKAEDAITDLDEFDIPLDICITPEKKYVFEKRNML